MYSTFQYRHHPCEKKFHEDTVFNELTTHAIRKGNPNLTTCILKYYRHLDINCQLCDILHKLGKAHRDTVNLKILPIGIRQN